MKNKLIGLRTIKTSIAVIIGMLIAQYFGLQNASIVAASIITSMATNIHESFRNSIFRLLSTLLGVLLAIFFQYIGFANAFSAGLGVLVIIVFCNLTNINRALILATLIFVSVLFYDFKSDYDLVIYAFNRLLDTLVGVAIGVLINILLFKPKQEQFLLASYIDTFDLMEKSLIGLLEGMRIDQEKLLNKLFAINTAYLNLRNDSKIKMNQHVEVIDIESLNNKIRLGISLLIDINQMNQPFNLTMESRLMINEYFEKKLLKETKLENIDLKSHSSIALNYEMDKIVVTFKSIDENLNKFVEIYGR